MAEEKEKKEKKEKKPAAKGKKAPKPRKKGKLLSKLYSLTGERIQRLTKFCPKCGAGVFMARHADRMVCGKCKYVEFGRK